jgi:hypothetical protein
MKLLPLTLALFVIGVALMLAGDGPATRVPGMTALFGFIVCGVFLIARPEFLGRDED